MTLREVPSSPSLQCTKFSTSVCLYTEHDRPYYIYRSPSSFSASGFFFRFTFTGKLLLANLIKATVINLVLQLTGFRRLLRFIVPTSKYLFIVAFPNVILRFDIGPHGLLSESAVFDRFSHISRTLGLHFIFQEA
jgi:hypothetical protein